ncbi:response regulator [Kitasatospora sp. NPDC001309]|uniref:response regulator n=1 Tax=Kitasatospora sp. NPDC001309 TaxID=3364013 RepID=UPI003680B969
MIRVAVVDDEALIRSALRLILNVAAGIEVVAAVPGGQALEAVAEYAPDLVLLDIRMPDVDGLTVLRRLMELPEPPVVAMLTNCDSDEHIAQALRDGASGYLLKGTDPDGLAPMVRSLSEGLVVLDPKVVPTVVNGYLRHHRGLGSAAAGTAGLTERERGVLIGLSRGLTNGEIAAAMHLSPGTVKGHVGELLAKLRVANRLQAALWAQRAGLLAEDAHR